MGGDTERKFPFTSGDKIRLPRWDADRYVYVLAYGDVMLLGLLYDANGQLEESSWYKDAETAYGEKWELYSPAPAEQEGYLIYDENGSFFARGLFLDHPRHNDRQQPVWKVRITPIERVWP